MENDAVPWALPDVLSQILAYVLFVYYASAVPINAYFDIDSRCCQI